MKSNAPESADGENVFPQRNLHVALVDVRHFDGKQETSFVLLDRDILVFLKKRIRVTCWRHALHRVCRHRCSDGSGRTIAQYSYWKRAGLANAHHLVFNGVVCKDPNSKLMMIRRDKNNDFQSYCRMNQLPIRKFFQSYPVLSINQC
jgi:hypothetical protein